MADGLAAAGADRGRRARSGDRAAVESAGPWLARAAPRPCAVLRRSALQWAAEAMAGGRVPGATAAVARPLERIRQFLTRMWCGRMAVNEGTAEYRVGRRSTVIWFRSSGIRIRNLPGGRAGVLGEGSRCCLQSLLAFRLYTQSTYSYTSKSQCDTRSLELLVIFLR